MSDFSNIEACPVRNVLDRLSDKWTMLVILVLGESKEMRFNEIHKRIGDISEKMLTVSLRKLEADGLISREVYPVIPPKVEYKLTALGQELLPLIDTITQWADRHMQQILQNRQQYNA
ncbi:winged helix-turn-helix transcriptional regulator [Sphingobacterium yanglingense]|uniref:HxlR family transcriptional regulator n=1 Tax=Sphingobacterium yanglingense TaxID=1437280 RepID=A0A4R6W1M1_9SPHI|nr:helix-turn-helix domain-containing protein [Sphingobacterium yanglingense]TDQ72281.1 HxlR family transcriptional regulator [Sphingobacterium yanglingense]